MIDESLLVKVCQFLNEHNVEYIIVGGFACALHGHTRATNDIDVLVKDNDSNLNKIISCKSGHELLYSVSKLILEILFLKSNPTRIRMSH